MYPAAAITAPRHLHADDNQITLKNTKRKSLINYAIGTLISGDAWGMIVCQSRVGLSMHPPNKLFEVKKTSDVISFCIFIQSG